MGASKFRSRPFGTQGDTSLARTLQMVTVYPDGVSVGLPTQDGRGMRNLGLNSQSRRDFVIVVRPAVVQV
jgi:hypothetical protein